MKYSKYLPAILVLLMPASVLAVSNTYNFPDPFAGASIPMIISRVVQTGLSIAGALFFVMFLWGGARYLTAGGDSKHVESAKKILINAVIGLVIVALSYVIVAQIFGIIIAGGGGVQTVQ
ncbi:MAG: pilin [bacterium]|nr:pilin [bacterium]